MKTSRSLFSIIFMAFMAFQSAQAGTIVLSPTAPTTDIIDNSQDTGGINSNLFSFAGNANNVRGDTFNVGTSGGTGFLIESITVQKNNTAGEQAGSVGNAITYNTGAFLNLQIFSGTEADFLAGSGRTTDTDPLAGTMVTEIAAESFGLAGVSIQDDDFVTFQLTSPIMVADNADLGFVLDYDPGTGDPNRFGYSENGNGGRLAVTATDHVTSSRGIRFIVQGTVVPEPGSFLLIGLASIGLLALRRR